MQFVPGSHRTSDVLPHHTQNNNPRIHGLEVDHPSEHTKNIVSCPLSNGGATFHHCRTLHYTGPNRSNELRRAYTLQFQCNTKQRDSPRPNSWNETKTTEREKRAKESGWNLRAP
jgi:ectoine hydroxylase-related dioxygenase (phytanoyl-CoA dioxygenase family)